MRDVGEWMMKAPLITILTVLSLGCGGVDTTTLVLPGYDVTVVPPIHYTSALLGHDGGSLLADFTDSAGHKFRFQCDYGIGTETPSAIYTGGFQYKERAAHMLAPEGDAERLLFRYTKKWIEREEDISIANMITQHVFAGRARIRAKHTWLNEHYSREQQEALLQIKDPLRVKDEHRKAWWTAQAVQWLN